MIRLFLRTLRSPSGAFAFIALISFVWVQFNVERWKGKDVINQDPVMYYAYLPAAFIYHDLTFEFKSKLPEGFDGRIWTGYTEEGKQYLKMSSGMAILYMPFFWAAHAHATLSPTEPADGYSWPYHMYISLSGAFYAFLGLLLVRRLLLRYYGEGVVLAVLFSLAAATNLLHYATMEGAMSHAGSFFLFALFLNLCLRWEQNRNWQNTLILGLTWGLITLIRPNNIIVILLPALYGINSLSAIWPRIQQLLKEWPKLLLLGASAFMVFFIQMAYWKYTVGTWLHYTYDEEGFFFNNPQIINGLFSYRKGWLIYTPIMGFALLGLVLMRNAYQEFRWGIIAFILLNFYIVFSWWCWWYGGSFGMRSLIETYAFLALPMAACYRWLWQRKSLLPKLMLPILILGFAVLNCWQTRQYRITLIHWDSMTQQSYWAVFGKRQFPENWENMLQPPKYDDAVKGIEEY